jgi:hypothetical protein
MTENLPALPLPHTRDPTNLLCSTAHDHHRI